jgi:hypothetical protein
MTLMNLTLTFSFLVNNYIKYRDLVNLDITVMMMVKL